LAAAIARIPEPVPMSKNDCAVPVFATAHNFVQAKRSGRMLAGAEAQAGIENHDGLVFCRGFFCSSSA
jgi:hypothetical protein